MGVGPLSSVRQVVPRFDLPETVPSLRAVPRALLRWVAESALSERDRWPLWLPVAFGAGIGIYFSLPAEPSSPFAVALGISGVLLGLAAVGAASARAKAVQAVLGAVLIGFFVAKHRTESVAAPVLAHRLSAVGVEGKVASVEIRPKGSRAIIDVFRIDRLLPEATPRAVRISMRHGGEALKPGDWIAVRAALLPPPEPAAPGGYDFGRSAFFQQIGAVGFAYGRPRAIAPLSHPSFPEEIATKIEGVRWRISNRIRAALPGSTGSIAAALITGDRGGISDDDQAALRDAGLAHVLAISGLNMALVGLGLFWTVRALLALIPPIALTQPIKKWAAFFALIGAAFYLLISGASTPAIRAFLMLAIMLVAILADRPALSMRSVAFAAVLTLAIQPEALIEPGFQMSFAAVASLIAVAEWERSREPAESGMLPLRKVRRYLRGIAVTSLVGSIATAPFAIYHFDRATHYAILGNLGAMPIIGFVIMPAAAIAVILMPLGLEAYPLQVMGWGIELMLAIGRRVAELPGSVSVVSAWPVAALVLLALGGLWIILWQKSWRWLGVMPCVVAAMLVFASKQPDVLVARDGVTVAIRSGDGRMHFVRPPADEYSAEEWLKRDGDERVPAEAVAHSTDGIQCDAYSCIGRVGHGTRIAVVLRADALGEDCAANDIVISAIPTRGRCHGPRIVIDRFDISRNGAYALRLRGDQIEIETVRRVRGDRPWSLRLRPQYRRIRPTSLP